MNEVLKINYETEQPTVSARELHEALGVASRFSRWFDSNKELFVEGEDYNKCTSSTVVNNGARRELEDYSMSVLMAKHICLMSRTEKGKRCRDYLIDLEKAWNTPEQIMARALKMANHSIESLKGSVIYLVETALSFHTEYSIECTGRESDCRQLGWNRITRDTAWCTVCRG